MCISLTRSNPAPYSAGIIRSRLLFPSEFCTPVFVLPDRVQNVLARQTSSEFPCSPVAFLLKSPSSGTFEVGRQYDNLACRMCTHERSHRIASRAAERVMKRFWLKAVAGLLLLSACPEKMVQHSIKDTKADAKTTYKKLGLGKKCRWFLR